MRVGASTSPWSYYYWDTLTRGSQNRVLQSNRMLELPWHQLRPVLPVQSGPANHSALQKSKSSRNFCGRTRSAGHNKKHPASVANLHETDYYLVPQPLVVGAYLAQGDGEWASGDAIAEGVPTYSKGAGAVCGSVPVGGEHFGMALRDHRTA